MGLWRAEFTEGKLAHLAWIQGFADCLPVEYGPVWSQFTFGSAAARRARVPFHEMYRAVRFTIPRQGDQRPTKPHLPWRLIGDVPELARYHINQGTKNAVP